MDDVLNLMSFAIDKKPTEFQTQLNDTLMARAAEAIEQKRIEIAQGLYGGEGPAEVEDSSTDDLDDSALDFDDEDVTTDFEETNEEEEEAELDFDLDDLDLEDLDLEESEADEQD